MFQTWYVSWFRRMSRRLPGENGKRLFMVNGTAYAKALWDAQKDTYPEFGWSLRYTHGNQSQRKQGLDHKSPPKLCCGVDPLSWRRESPYKFNKDVPGVGWTACISLSGSNEEHIWDRRGLGPRNSGGRYCQNPSAKASGMEKKIQDAGDRIPFSGAQPQGLTTQWEVPETVQLNGGEWWCPSLDDGRPDTQVTCQTNGLPSCGDAPVSLRHPALRYAVSHIASGDQEVICTLLGNLDLIHCCFPFTLRINEKNRLLRMPDLCSCVRRLFFLFCICVYVKQQEESRETQGVSPKVNQFAVECAVEFVCKPTRAKRA